MFVSLIILASLVVVGLPLYLLYRRDLARGGGDVEVSQPGRPEGCCGQHEVCERELLIADASRPVVYYDDEELDRFAGRESTAYSEEESEEFREVLLTLRPDEVAAWGRSLQLRAIEMPLDVREEFLMIVSEMRDTNEPNNEL